MGGIPISGALSQRKLHTIKLPASFDLRASFVESMDLHSHQDAADSREEEFLILPSSFAKDFNTTNRLADNHQTTSRPIIIPKNYSEN